MCISLFVSLLWIIKEAYGNVSTDSSDDEDYDGTASPRKRKESEFAPVSPNGKNKETDHTPKRRTRQKANIEDTNNSPTKSLDGSCKPGSSGERSRSSAYKRLGEAVTQVIASYCLLLLIKLIKL
jgi:hypothetical protein